VKAAFVTGGSRGIGAAVSKQLAAVGYDVFINCRKVTCEAELLVEAIQRDGGGAKLVEGDVRHPRELIECLLRMGCTTLDVLVNNAGIVRDALVPQTSLDDWNATLATNFWGAVGVFRECEQMLLQAECGVVVSIGSISGLRPRKGHGAYCVSKAMLIEWTRQLGQASAHRSLRFFCLSPGPTETTMIQSANWYAAPDAQKRVPLGRFASPAEIAGWVAFLAQRPHTIANGENIVLDGGLLKT
jgi:3-oxoacyl-[acyl-carrier protein] reductase